jgi:hypothetical protein
LQSAQAGTRTSTQVRGLSGSVESGRSPRSSSPCSVIGFADGCSAPKLAIVASLDPPDCVRVAATYPFSSYVNDKFTGTHLGHVDTVYLRLKVRNDGRSLAREVQVFAESVTRFRSGGDWELVTMFPSMNLPWSDLPRRATVRMRMFFPGLGPTMSKHCDLGRLADPRGRHRIGDAKDDLDAQNNVFAFETLVKPNHGGHIVGPGTYRIRLLLAAENARPVPITVELIVRPDWRPEDPASMLGIRVV